MTSTSQQSHARRWIEVVAFIVYAIIPSVLLQVTAGGAAFWQAVVFGLVVLAVALPLIFTLLEHPSLLLRRLHFGPGAEQGASQRVIVSLLIVFYPLLYVVAGLDHRFGWSHMPVLVVLVGDLVFAGGLILITLVFRANAFAAASVQVEAGQKVIASGPYALVRHPMYSGILLLFLGVPVALGSWWGLAVFFPLLLLTIWRLLEEEQYLTKNLPGYRDYRAKVTHRLIPGIW
jgi:protein-S-isoprenylcysteine O-methyltransferase Ste14